MGLHHIGHVILEWSARKLGYYLFKEFLDALKTAFFNSSFWRTLTASIFVLTFPVERIVRVMRIAVVILLFAGLIGAVLYVRRSAQLSAAC